MFNEGEREKQMFELWKSYFGTVNNQVQRNLIFKIISQEKSMIEQAKKESIKEFAGRIIKKIYELGGYVSAIEKTAIELLLKEYEEI
jgi:hypothetical protein